MLLPLDLPRGASNDWRLVSECEGAQGRYRCVCILELWAVQEGCSTEKVATGKYKALTAENINMDLSFVLSFRSPAVTPRPGMNHVHCVLGSVVRVIENQERYII